MKQYEEKVNLNVDILIYDIDIQFILLEILAKFFCLQQLFVFLGEDSFEQIRHA